MRQSIAPSLGVRFPTLCTVRGREWLSLSDLFKTLQVRCDFEPWARSLFYAEQGFWVPNSSTTSDFVAPCIGWGGLTGGVSAREICRQGETDFHLRQLAAARGLEICLHGQSFFPWSAQRLLIDMFPVQFNSHVPGLFIICPSVEGRHKVDVVGVDECLPSERFPDPIRVLFGQRLTY